MPWYQVLIPAVTTAVLVRIEAVFIGPYWAWVELIPELGEWEESGRARRLALVRRVAIPAASSFALVTLWKDTYSPWDAALIGVLAAGLLLWPAVVHGLPWNVRSRDWEIVAIYSALVVAFGSSAWTGATISTWIDAEYGSLGSFLRQELVNLLFGLVLTAFAIGAFDRVSTRSSNRG